MNADGWLVPASMLIASLVPVVQLSVLTALMLLRRPLSERAVGRLLGSTFVVAVAAANTGLISYFATDMQPQVIPFGQWFGGQHGSFALEFVADGVSLGFGAVSVTICAIVAAFSFRYLHREPGFYRYFIQLVMFVLGIMLVSFAGSIGVLFAGWEFLGLSSALLVGFFHERQAPVRNALRIFGVYRISDAAMLSAAVLLHHWLGSGSLSRLLLRPDRGTDLSGEQTLLILTLFLIAVAAKSALVPFSAWLPRAMEGPTPSSAVYYGALSIHAGCFLLLRLEPLFAHSDLARALIGLCGVVTALHATVTARVQTDVKSALAYASLTQVGLIVVEIALGFTGVAFIHIVGHMCFRLLQFLSAPNILHDLHGLESRSLGRVVPGRGNTLGGPSSWLYLAGLERGFLDQWLDAFLIKPFSYCGRQLDRLDRALCGTAREVRDQECQRK